ncbi:hypothetical protein [Lacisediminimonas profundi]|uniref:hypothetical protein n=1 Tax=Lacisediminimonas profundi TaxID=2603856 RepID=UPI00124B74A4|nr:hypothetical protein [Lacisediminimonas profundi]
MSFQYRLLPAALAWLSLCLPLGASAQSGPPSRPPASIQARDPADPASPVPPLMHASVFGADSGGRPDETRPDRNWRAANDQVRQLSGHAGHIKPAAGASQHGKH